MIQINELLEQPGMRGQGVPTSFASIVLGAALLAEGMAIAGGYSKLLEMIADGTLGAVEPGGNMMVEVLDGGAAIVLGILALTIKPHAAPLTLVGPLVLGAAMATNATPSPGDLPDSSMPSKHEQTRRLSGAR